VAVRLGLSPPKKENMSEEKRYELIDLNFGFEDLMVESFKECIRANNIQPQPILLVSPDPIDILMETLASIVHRDYVTPIVEKKTDLKLIPTYCYVRKYFQGSTLSTHTDRDACEISLTYCVSGPEWGIHMGDDTVTTKKGNGVIYRGCEVEHGRPEPSSGEVIQVFNHWVISDGSKSKNAYDDGRYKDFYNKVIMTQ
jgi:hypothetical protein